MFKVEVENISPLISNGVNAAGSGKKVGSIVCVPGSTFLKTLISSPNRSPG